MGFAALYPSYRLAFSVGWVERSETHHAALSMLKALK